MKPILFIIGSCISAAPLKNSKGEHRLKKANIEKGKANIGPEKVNIEDTFSPKTASHIQVLQKRPKSEPAFGRSQVQQIFRLKPTRRSERLLIYSFIYKESQANIDNG